MLALALVTAVVIGGQAGSPPPPQADPTLIRVHVQTDDEGTAAEIADRRESVEDLTDILGRKKTLVMVAREADADVVIAVTERTLTTPRIVIGVGARPGQPPGGNAPARAVRLRVEIAAARDSDPDAITSKNSPLEANRGWRSAADDVAKQVEQWIADRRDAIIRGRTNFVASPFTASAEAAQAKSVVYLPTAGVQTFAVRPPVLTIAPGTTVETKTFSRPGDYYDGGAWPGEVGPFAIEGAAAGDTLVVQILKLQPNRDTAMSRYSPGGISGVAGDSRTRMLNDPLPARTFLWRLDRTRMVGILDLPDSASKRVEIPLRPMLGRVAVAPAGEEAFGGLWPGDFGGNLDALDVAEGATVYLPVFHPRALFYFGDGHAAQGDGEIMGSGLETTMDVTFKFDVIKGQRIRWPRIETADHIMVAASIRPLVDAMRIAYVELIEWLVADYGFDKMEAFQVASQVGEVRVANIVDPNYTVVAKFPKRLLPPRQRR